MNYRKLKKILRSTAFVCTFCTICGIMGTGAEIKTDAATTQAEIEALIKENEKHIAELDDKIAATEGDIATSEVLQASYYQKLVAQQEGIDLLNTKLFYKEEEIAAKEDEIAGVEIDIAETEKQIEDKKIEIAALEDKNDKNIKRFGQLVRTMYINDTDDVLNVLAGSADFYDIFVKSEMMENITEQSHDFMTELLDDIHGLEDDKLQFEKDVAQLEEDKAQLEQDKADLEAEWTLLDEEKAYSSQLAAQYTEEYNDYTAYIANLEDLKAQYAYEQKVSREEIEAYEKQIDEIIRQAQLAASNTVVYDQGEWIWPLDPKFTLITTYFGFDPWRNGNHGAIDVGNGGINGANIYAMKGV